MSRIGWDDYFMSVARIVAKRSSCDRANVGAVIVQDRVIVSSGYNGGVCGLVTCMDDGHLLVDGHCVRTVHAEVNAVLQTVGKGVCLRGASVYVTHFPCLNCAKVLAQIGVGRVFYLNDYRNSELAVDMFRTLGVECVKLAPVDLVE